MYNGNYFKTITKSGDISIFFGAGSLGFSIGHMFRCFACTPHPVISFFLKRYNWIAGYRFAPAAFQHLYLSQH